ncbi:ferredoxin--NADP reductase [Haladaptatus halobius]|uniref:ferredoxin--NADP reductase n=1 Tax=Haladaptatus halobius TaxID=2884875 RepID=UPI001D0B9CC3|nr:FAD-dependent oxidoreductase [Haladaptatus halobius]
MREVEIASIHQMTPRVKQFRLVDDEPFDFEPGQHTHLHFEREAENGDGDGNGEDESGDGNDEGREGGENSENEEDDADDEVVRPYTATSLPGTNSITLAIKRYDDGTASVYMHDREPGDTIRIEDLGGNLYLRNLKSDVAFVSTGTGITPMMAMLKQYLRAGEGRATFLYGEKTQEDIMYRETLDQLESEHENLTVAYSLSETEWEGRTGHVQDHVEAVVPDPEATEFYVCGVPEMVVETKEKLAAIEVPDESVYSEGWEGDAVSGD